MYGLRLQCEINNRSTFCKILLPSLLSRTGESKVLEFHATKSPFLYGAFARSWVLSRVLYVSPSSPLMKLSSKRITVIAKKRSRLLDTSFAKEPKRSRRHQCTSAGIANPEPRTVKRVSLDDLLSTPRLAGRIKGPRELIGLYSQKLSQICSPRRRRLAKSLRGSCRLEKESRHLDSPAWTSDVTIKQSDQVIT